MDDARGKTPLLYVLLADGTGTFLVVQIVAGQEMRRLAVERGDQPYGAVIVKVDRIVGEGASAVVIDNDPTAHAEMVAIRDAVRRLGSRDLSGCEMYGTSPACPMCEAGAYWARVARLLHGATIVDAGPPRLR
jgi:tRNA(Arg) A34 adenosine deaminase TadA